jgi:flagellar hook assembly protein FlgD
LEFTLSQAGRVSLAVFDAAGRRVRSLAEGAFAPGKHSLKWDGRDADGHLAPTGLYFMRLESGGQAITQKTVIAR